MKIKFNDIGRCLICLKNPCQCKKTNMKTEEKLKIAIEALQKLSEPEGRFNRDPLKWANNTIEDMVDIAKETLKILTSK